MRFAPAYPVVMAISLGLAACGGAETDESAAAAEAVAADPTSKMGPIQKASYERLNRDETKENMAEILGAMEEGAAMPGKDEMEFDWLDRNDDGKLNVAEFALWKLEELSADLAEEQVTEAASAFFTNDNDGDSLLNEGEFAAATGRPEPDSEQEENS